VDDSPGTETPAIPSRRAAVSSGRAAADPAPKATLAEEVKALDAARAALGRGDGIGAIAALDAYGRAYPRGLLAHEATVLRVEALFAVGDRTNATRIGRAFLAQAPRSPYATHLRALLGE
jgi:TolA-binding protein